MRHRKWIKNAHRPCEQPIHISFFNVFKYILRRNWNKSHNAFKHYSRTDNNWSYSQWQWRLYASITGKQINEPNEHKDLPSVYFFYLLLIAKSQRTALFTNIGIICGSSSDQWMRVRHRDWMIHTLIGILYFDNLNWFLCLCINKVCGTVLNKSS